jgi:hypothetical protein
MFEILDRTGTVVTTATTRHEALRVQTSLELCTLQPHHLRVAKDAAVLLAYTPPAWAFATLDAAYNAGAVTLPW